MEQTEMYLGAKFYAIDPHTLSDPKLLCILK